jgi:type II secretory pathway component PulK
VAAVSAAGEKVGAETARASNRRKAAGKDMRKAGPMKNRRRGVVLLLVLIVVTMLALGSLGFAELMLNEHRAAQTASRQSQARAFAESGAEVARQFLDRTADDQQTAGGLYDNAQRFSSQLVADDDSPRDRGRFTILAPKIEDTAVIGVRYGLQDESARINLATILNYDQSSGSSDGGDTAADNTYAHAILMGLPGMTDDTADAILDWIDADDTPRDQGAESDFYGSLDPGYTPRDRPPTSIEELLLVRGVTPELLFGYDAVKMGYSSSDSVSGAISGIDNDGSMDHGWAAYLTLWSAESTLKADGTPKINLNQTNLQTLYSQLTSVLDPSWAQYIVCYRQGGGTLDGGGQLITSQLGQGINTISSPLDLVGARVTVVSASPAGAAAGPAGAAAGPAGGSAGGGGRGAVLQNPFTTDTSAMGQYLPKLFDNCTTVSGTSIPGRININQAPRPVLLCIPGMTSDLADQIISNRVPDPTAPTAQADRTCPAWPLIEGIMPLATMKSILPYITAGGSVYRAQIIGHFDKGNPVARLEVILDATQNPTRVLFWKAHEGAFPGGAEAFAKP